ncbi:MAG TPA: hypothetical protein VI612_01005, partial [Candidatus Nanoarchaeia archaeon]|nr:hypothetical protein [Candidatus Nanoarchaeia archaeon]
MVEWKKLAKEIAKKYILTKEAAIFTTGLALAGIGYLTIGSNRVEQPAQTLDAKVASEPSETQEKDFIKIVYAPEITGQSVAQSYKVHTTNAPLRKNLIALIERDKLAMSELQQNGHDKLDPYLTAQVDAFIDNPEYEHDPGI